MILAYKQSYSDFSKKKCLKIEYKKKSKIKMFHSGKLI